MKNIQYSLVHNSYQILLGRNYDDFLPCIRVIPQLAPWLPLVLLSGHKSLFYHPWSTWLYSLQSSSSLSFLCDWPLENVPSLAELMQEWGHKYYSSYQSQAFQGQVCGMFRNTILKFSFWSICFQVASGKSNHTLRFLEIVIFPLLVDLWYWIASGWESNLVWGYKNSCFFFTLWLFPTIFLRVGVLSVFQVIVEDSLPNVLLCLTMRPQPFQSATFISLLPTTLLLR